MNNQNDSLKGFIMMVRFFSTKEPARQPMPSVALTKGPLASFHALRPSTVKNELDIYHLSGFPEIMMMFNKKDWLLEVYHEDAKLERIAATLLHS